MIVIRGHLGFGDCIHQRAIIKTFYEMGETEIVLETFYGALYGDLVEKHGLILKPISGHPPRVRELVHFRTERAVKIPANAFHARLSYSAATVRRFKNILGAQYACCGLTMPEKPDFSIDVPEQWRALARERVGPTDKPIMVYRPTVLNNVFRCESRLPDLESYKTLYESIRDQYHVVSVANVGDHGEHIAGPEMDVEVKFNHGELAFEELAGLFAEAGLAFTCAGYAPVLAQAVRTPTVIVYGGHEAFGTTNVVGQHLAPTLAIQPDNACECHGGHYFRVGHQLVKPVATHVCPKELDVPLALQRLKEFTCAL